MSYGILWHGAVLHFVMWYDTVWYVVITCGMVWHGMVRCGVFDVVSFGVVLCGLV